MGISAHRTRNSGKASPGWPGQPPSTRLGKGWRTATGWRPAARQWHRRHRLRSAGSRRARMHELDDSRGSPGCVADEATDGSGNGRRAPGRHLGESRGSSGAPTTLPPWPRGYRGLAPSGRGLARSWRASRWTRVGALLSCRHGRLGRVARRGPRRRPDRRRCVRRLRRRAVSGRPVSPDCGGRPRGIGGVTMGEPGPLRLRGGLHRLSRGLMAYGIVGLVVAAFFNQKTV